MKKKPKVLVCTPRTRFVEGGYIKPLIHLLNYPDGTVKGYHDPENSLVHISRNDCVREAGLVRADYIFFLDSDTTVPPDTIKKLLAHGKDIVGATYMKRKLPFEMTGLPLGVRDGDRVALSGLMGMDWMPTGCLLIKMTVFDKIKPPYFSFSYDGEKLCGEDYNFCQSARKAGVKVWCDGDISLHVGHIGEMVYRIKDHAPRMDKTESVSS